MKTKNDITRTLGTLCHPKSALVFYKGQGNDAENYVEYFTMDKNGSPVNAHPLTVREAVQLSKMLNIDNKKDKAFLTPKSIIPTAVLHYDPSENGRVLWYSRAQDRLLFFLEELGIPSGKAKIPPLIWHADKRGLSLYALAGNRRPKQGTALYHAPFFNVYESASVCMGTVDVNIKNSASLEEFTSAWENYFFNSYFSHLMQGHNPVRGNCVSLWKKIIQTKEDFPLDRLLKTDKTLKDLLP